MYKAKLLIITFLIGSGAFLHGDAALAQAINGNNGLRGAIAFPNQQQSDDGFGSNPAQPLEANAEEQNLAAPIPEPRAQNLQQNAQRSNIAASTFPNDSTDQPSTENAAVDPAQSGNAVAPPEDEFAPTGFRIGTFEANASLEQSVGYSSNISGDVDGEAGGFSQTDVTLGLTSDWSRHQLQANVSGSYEKPFDDEEIEQPSLLADAALRLDLVDGVTLTTAGFYNLQTQSFTSSILAPGAVDNPITENYGGSIALQRDDRKLQYTLTANVNRNTFEDADLGGGAITSQEDQNNTEYGITARLGYEVSPAITPFIEGRYAIREFDLEVDRNGNRRDSEIFAISGGVDLDFGEKLRGEISAGYLTEQFEDPALEDLNAVTANASLFWSPERETEIELSFGTETNSSITTDENGSVSYTTRAELERQITARLSINAFASYEFETNDENDQTIELGVGLEYWVNRFTALTADVEYNQFSSDDAGSSFDEVQGRLGVRFQR